MNDGLLFAQMLRICRLSQGLLSNITGTPLYHLVRTLVSSRARHSHRRPRIFKHYREGKNVQEPFAHFAVNGCNSWTNGWATVRAGRRMHAFNSRGQICRTVLLCALEWSACTRSWREQASVIVFTQRGKQVLARHEYNKEMRDSQGDE